MKRARLFVNILNAAGNRPCAGSSKHAARGIRAACFRSGNREGIVPLQVRESDRVRRAERVSCKNRSAPGVDLHQFEMRAVNNVESKRESAGTGNRADEFERTATCSAVDRKDVSMQRQISLCDGPGVVYILN